MQQMPPKSRRARRAWHYLLPALLTCALILMLLRTGAAEPVHPLRTLGLRTLGQTRNAAAHKPPWVTLTVVPGQPGIRFALGAVGLSVEADELATQDLSATHKSLVTLMRLLGPAVLRLGGDSVDFSWWMSSSEPRPPWATSVVTPADLMDLRQLLIATGWRVVLGLDLGHFDPTRAASEAHSAETILGSRLLGFEIGNEPDDYSHGPTALRPSTYNASDFLNELATYIAAIRSVIPVVRVFGPDLSSQAWLPAIAASRTVSFTAITQHFYPTSYNDSESGCRTTPVPSALDLLSPSVREHENSALQGIMSAGHIAQREARVSETNSTGSCNTSGGPETSPVFASALWSLDWALRAASAGVSGLNFHGYFGVCAQYGFNPICAPDLAAERLGRVIARPEYYGLLAARQLEGGDFIPLQAEGLAPQSNLTGYATLHAHGLITLAIDNANAARPVLVDLPTHEYRRATYERLVGPSLQATHGVTLGHASLSTTNTAIRLPRSTALIQNGDGFKLTLPPASAVVITLYR
jgi:hypothetical protein